MHGFVRHSFIPVMSHKSALRSPLMADWACKNSSVCHTIITLEINLIHDRRRVNHSTLCLSMCFTFYFKCYNFESLGIRSYTIHCSTFTSNRKKGKKSNDGGSRNPKIIYGYMGNLQVKNIVNINGDYQRVTVLEDRSMDGGLYKYVQVKKKLGKSITLSLPNIWYQHLSNARVWVHLDVEIEDSIL